ncbi:MAG: gluconokinase [Terriglobales bacterium]
MIWIVMGAAGSGKTTVGRALAAARGCAFLEGDSLHPPANIAKMAAGVPLQDADRAPWLAAIRQHLEAAVRQGQDLVVACSALKQRYRDPLDQGLPVVWVYLRATEEVLHRRLEQRQGHYMKADMLASQLADLEEPNPGAALIFDATLPPETIAARVLATL